MSAEGSVCPKCGEGILESRAKTSSLVCNHCGDVAEESAAVTALEWAEGAGGTSGVTGTYIIGNAPRGVGGEGGEVRARAREVGRTFPPTASAACTCRLPCPTR